MKYISLNYGFVVVNFVYYKSQVRFWGTFLV